MNVLVNLTSCSGRMNARFHHSCNGVAFLEKQLECLLAITLLFFLRKAKGTILPQRTEAHFMLGMAVYISIYTRQK